jgi:hypothetical protein
MNDAINELLNSTEATITPTQAAKVMRCSPYRFNVLYKLGQLPFPAMLSGNRLKILRIPFLKYLGYE